MCSHRAPRSSSMLCWLFSSTVMSYNELLAAAGAIYLSAILICKCDGLKQMSRVAFKWWEVAVLWLFPLFED